MKFKTKLVSILTLFVVVFSFMIVGVLAVKQTNFNVGGNINFRATGINAVISEGTLNNALWVDESEAENKLKEIILNTYKTGEEIEEEFLSWQGLNLMFNENGEDATITFSITNTSEHEEYFSVNASVNQGTSTNATVDITPKMVELAPGKSQDYTITFSITDSEINASILDFKIDLDMQLINILTASEYPTLTFSYNNTNYTASVKANTSNKPTGELVLPSFVEYNSEVYLVSAITSASSITYGAFSNCTGLTSITIPNSMTSLGAYAFYNCSGITNVDIPKSITLEQGVFYNCSGLTSIEIPENALEINNTVFMNCSSLTSIEIPSSVTRIGNSAFKGCTGLTGELALPNSVTRIGNSAFKGCTGLIGELALPNSVTTIGASAFEGCTGLTGELALPNSVTSIWNSAFKGCTGLSGELIIPNGVTSIEFSAFEGCSGFSGELFIPDSVTSIGNNAFKGCSGLTGELVIPDGVTSISYSAFENCSGLTSIKIPNSVTTIGGSAFKGCSRLTSMNYLGDINSWVSISFSNSYYANPTYYTKSLTINGETVTNAVIDTATSINGYSFYNCQSLSSVTIGNQVTSIGNSAFSGCSGLTSMNYLGDINSWVSISFGDSSSNPTYYTKSLVINGETVTNAVIDTATSINGYSFYNCQSLSSVTIGNQVTSIGNSAFSGCSGWTGELELSNGLTSIGNFAFKGCSRLTGELVIPSSVTSIGHNAFEGCSRLTGELVIPSSVTSIGGSVFENCSGFTSIEIPNGITIIGYGLFKSCSGLISVKIPNSVTTIGGEAFNYCPKLESIIIPSSVTSIGTKAFQTCTKLTKVIIDSSTIAGAISGTGTSVCGGLIANATSIYVKTDIVSSLNSYVTTNYTNVTAITEGEYAGYTLYSRN